MDPLEIGLGPQRKIGYSFIGLLVGDLVMLILFSMLNNAWEQPPSILLRTFSFYMNCSLFGWVAIGIPAVLLINTNFVSKLRWFLVPPFGIALGTIAMLLIFLIIGHLPPGQTGGFAYYWMFAALVSGIAFSIYCALVRNGLRLEEESIAPIKPVNLPLDIFKTGPNADAPKSEPVLDIYKSDWLNTLEQSDPRRSTRK
jgi:hypothetical protein